MQSLVLKCQALYSSLPKCIAVQQTFQPERCFLQPSLLWTNADLHSLVGLLICLLDNLLISRISFWWRMAQNHIQQSQLEKRVKAAASAQHIRTFMAPPLCSYLSPTLSYFLNHTMHTIFKVVEQENVNLFQTVFFLPLCSLFFPLRSMVSLDKLKQEGPLKSY